MSDGKMTHKEYVRYATIRPAVNNHGEDELHIECRTSYDTKNTLIIIDGDRLSLARSICQFINTENPPCFINEEAVKEQEDSDIVINENGMIRNEYEKTRLTAEQLQKREEDEAAAHHAMTGE